jgi:hypothetical protein
VTGCFWGSNCRSGWIFPTGPDYFGGIGKHGGQNAMSDIRQFAIIPN